MIATLALGLGATAALFSVIEQLFWQQPVAVTDAKQVRRLYLHYRDAPRDGLKIRSVYSYPELRDIMGAIPHGIAMAGYRNDAHIRLGRDRESPEVVGTFVVGDYFGTLGLEPALGRFFTHAETQIETMNQVAVISNRLWIDRYGGERNVLGQPLDLGSHRYSVIGIAPIGFRGIDLEATDVWIPMSTAGVWKGRDPSWYEKGGTLSTRIVARVATQSESNAFEVGATAALRGSRFVRDPSATAKLSSIVESVWPDSGAKELSIAVRLAAVAAIILLIACANVANLLLARSHARNREIAIRVALGASRARLVAQLMVESLLLSLAGGAFAVVIGSLGSAVLRHALLPDVVWTDSPFTASIVGFTLVLAMVSGLFVALLPALQASRPGPLGALRAGATEETTHRSRLRALLLLAQAAFSVVLLSGAGLFVLSLRNVEATNIGFDASRLIFATIGVDPEGDDHSAEMASRFPGIADRLRKVPGIERVAFAGGVPMRSVTFANIFLPNGEKPPSSAAAGPFVSRVSPEFFDATGLRVLLGRRFNDDDRTLGRPVVIVNSILARATWPGVNPIGKCVIVERVEDSCREVVGVVADAHFSKIIEPASMQLYLPVEQSGVPPSVIVVRTAVGRAAALAPRVREIVAADLGGWALPRARSMTEMLAPELHSWRLSAGSVMAAGLLALFISAVGIYASVAYAAGQRAPEIAVRRAIGAPAGAIVRLVVRDGLGIVTVGTAIGLVMSLVLGRFVTAILYGTSPRAPSVLITVTLTMIGVAAIACVVPAWRAVHLDPIAVLRGEGAGSRI